MQATVQTGSLSPKSLTEPRSSRQQKMNCEVSQKATSSPRIKGQKGEQAYQSLDHSKHDWLIKTDGKDVADLKREDSVESEELANIIDKNGGLVNLLEVDQLVHLMQQERNNSVKKADEISSWRTMLVAIIAATEKEECLDRFVQLGGLCVLNDWLQEARKRKDGGSQREEDKGSEELLLTLLQALDKLPVDLDALKTCVVGKSVNSLRSHKNLEIQKKSRKIVDMWKKRVDAEMKMMDELKTVANTTSEQCSIDVSQTHSVKRGAASEATVKNASAVKGMTSGMCPGDSVTKAPLNPEGLKVQCSNINLKGNLVKLHTGGIREVTLEKSDNPIQSQNNSQFRSSGSGKWTVSAWKEEGRKASVVSTVANSTATVILNNISSGNVQLLDSSCGSQKDPVGSMMHTWNRATAHENVSDGRLEKEASENIATDRSNDHNLTVRLAESGTFHSHSSSGGSGMDLPPVTSKDSSLNFPEKHDEIEAKIRMHTGNPVGSLLDIEIGNASKSGCGCEDNKKMPHSFVLADCVESGSSDFEHKSKVEAGDGRRVMLVSGVPVSTDTSTVCSEPPRTNNGGGVDLLANVAASESSESEKSIFGVAGRGSTSISGSGKESENDVRLLIMRGSSSSNDRAGNFPGHHLGPDKESQVDAGTDIGNGNCTPEGECLRERTELNELSIQRAERSLETVCYNPASLQEKLVIEKRGREEAMESASISGDFFLFADMNIVTAKKMECFEVSEGGCGDPRQELKETDIGAKASNMRSISDCCSGDALNGKYQDISIEACKDNLWSPVDSCKDAKEIAVSPGTVIRMHSVGDVQKVASESYEEDALEIARQVAVEVEQKVEQYGKSDQQDANIDSICIIQEIEGANALDPNRSTWNATIEMDATSKVGIADSQHLLDSAYSDESNKTVIEEWNCTEAQQAPGSGEIEVGQVHNDAGSVDRTKMVLDSTLTTVDTGEEGNQVFCVGEHNYSLNIFIPQQVANASVCGRLDGDATGIEQTVASLVTDDGASNEACSRPVFDLNERIAIDESFEDDGTTSTIYSVNHALIPNAALAPTATFAGVTSLIAAVTATKGAFIPPSNPVQSEEKLGWKGSSVTSAFQSTEALCALERQQSSSDAPTIDVSGGLDGKRAEPLDIDLNVPYESLLEDSCVLTAQSLQESGLTFNLHSPSLGSLSQNVVGFSNGDSCLRWFANSRHTVDRLVLDLNQADESEENATPIVSNSIVTGRITLGPGNNFCQVMRDFDLNYVPSLEDAFEDESTVQQVDFKTLGNSTLPSLVGLRMNSGVVNADSWSPLSTMGMLALSTARTEPPYQITSAVPSKSAGSDLGIFSGSLYGKGATIFSSPVIYSSTTMPAALSHTRFPLDSNFPFASAQFTTNSVPCLDSSVSTTVPDATSQLIIAGAVLSPYTRPYMMGITEASGVDSSEPMPRLNLDLNAGPDAVDVDARGERSNTRQALGFNQLSFQQAGLSGGALKRKEPEGGFDAFWSGFQ